MSISTTAKIASVEILPPNPDEGHYRALCRATFDNGETHDVLKWYNDELSFTEAEFIGLTNPEVVKLFMAKDKAYLQS